MLKIASITIVLLAYINAIAKEVNYECRPAEIVDINTGKTIEEINNAKIALMLHVAENKIFDGTYSYTYTSSKKYEQGTVKVYKHAPTNNSLSFPTFPMKENAEVDIRYVFFQEPKRGIAMYFNCANFDDIQKYRAKFKNSK